MLKKLKVHPARALWIGLLAAGLGGLCLPALWPGHFLFRWDTLIYNWPLALEIRAQWAAGQVPFWSDAFQCGLPLLANPNAGVLYPLAPLIWVCPFPWGYQLFLVVHILLAGLGLYVCLRTFRVLPAAAVAGALAYAGGGYAHSMWDTHNFIALPWIPFAFAALFSPVHGSRLRPALWTALAATLLILGGDIQAALIWWPVAALWASTRPDRRLRLTILAAAALFCLLWSAPQWLVTLNFFPESSRAAGLGDIAALARSFHPGRLLELFIPHAFGGRDAWFGYLLDGPHARVEQPWTASLHIGLIALWLAGWSVLRRRQPMRAGAPLLFALGFLILSFGRYCPGLAELARLPLIGSFRYPEKYLLWFVFFASLLAGLGAHRRWAAGRMPAFADRFSPFQCRLTLLLLAVELVLVFILAKTIAGPYPPAFSAAFPLRIATALAPWLALAGILVFMRNRTGMSTTALVLLLAAELSWAWLSENPLTTAFNPLDPPLVARTVQAARTPTARYLTDPELNQAPLPPYFARLRPSEKDAVVYRELLGFNTPRLWAIPTADGFSPLAVAAFQDFRQQPSPGRSADPDPLPVFCREAGVEWMLTEKSRVALFDRAGLTPESVGAWGPNGELQLLRLHPRPLCEATPQRLSAAVVFKKIRPHHARIDIPAGVERLLIRQPFVAGWTAADAQGRPLRVYRGAGPWTEISVTPGTRRIDLTYRPPGWGAGLILCALGCFLALVWATLASLHPNRRPAAQPMPLKA